MLNKMQAKTKMQVYREVIPTLVEAKDVRVEMKNNNKNNSKMNSKNQNNQAAVAPV